MVKTVVHAADLANPARPFPINCYMSTAIHAEFRCSCWRGGTRSWLHVWTIVYLVVRCGIALLQRIATCPLACTGFWAQLRGSGSTLRCSHCH